MHVLLTNDDGPLNDITSPYVKYFVDEIRRSTSWDLSIVVPHEQRSWIGKAHFAHKPLTSSYLYTTETTQETSDYINKFEGPFHTFDEKYRANGQYQEWCLLDGTPAACADIGIHHVYNESKGPVDLVISGPNFGKNTSNLYILSSGTVGAAMEAVTHGVKSIALSFSYTSINHDHDILRRASYYAVKLIKRLYPCLQNLNDIDLYSINIPLEKSLSSHVLYAPILQNQWHSIYSKTTEPSGREKFLWAPNFKKVFDDGIRDPTHSDSRVILDGKISVTPMKAAFKAVEPVEGEFDIENDTDDTLKKYVFLITVPQDSYIYDPLVTSLRSILGDIEVTDDKSTLASVPVDPRLKIVHYGDYEDLDLDLVENFPAQYIVPSYIYRKALIRKHYLASTIQHYICKRPKDILNTAFPRTYFLELDYAEFLDEALDDCYELRDEIENTNKTWILKPGMSDEGQGIRLFHSLGQLQKIFDSFEDEEDEKNETETGVITSQMREFIVQEYEADPLLLKKYSNKKFHLRVYVVAVGNLKVYVYKNILALFAEKSYNSPEENASGEVSLDGHLTNTCLQKGKTPLVLPFWSLDDNEFSQSKKEHVFSQVKDITRSLFDAATSVNKINFQPIENAYEIFGIDFIITSDLAVTLLEVNSYPDFKQTGDKLKPLISELFDNIARVAISPLALGLEPKSDTSLIPVFVDHNGSSPQY